MSQDSILSESPSSQPTEGGTPAPTPTSKWSIWSRGINPGGDWYCTHRFEDETETYHYVNKDGTHFMKHRDGSATFVLPKEGKYIPRGGHNPKSTLPVPTMEEIIKEHEEIKEEHRQYLARPVKYWNGARTTYQTGRRFNDLSWLFPTCDCGDRFSTYDDDYPVWEGEYDHDYEDDYDMSYEGYGRNSEEDSEGEEYNDSEGEEEEEEDREDDSRSPSPGECKPTIERGGNETVVRTTDGVHPPAVEEAKVDVKQETSGEVLYGPVIMHLTIPKSEAEGNSTSPTPNATPESAATGSGKITSCGSGIGPDLETEAKKMLRSHRAKPY